MLPSFQDLPIRRKVLVIVAVSGLVLSMVVSVAVTIFQHAAAQANFRRILWAQAEIVAANCRAALAFGDQQAAKEILAALGSEPSLECACLYLADRTFFAHFGITDDRDELPPDPLPTGILQHESELSLFHPITLEGRKLGTLFLHYDTRRLQSNWLQTLAASAGSVGLLTLVAALLAGLVVQRTLAQPVLRLAAVAQSIAERQDFSERAPATGRDEVGTLTEAFNSMLVRIQQQDTALRDSETRYRLLFEHSPLPVFAYEAQSLSILDANDAAIAEYGLSMDALRHMRFVDLGEPGDPLAKFFLVTNPPANAAFEVRHRRADGSWMDVQVATHAIEMKGRSARLALCIDITDRKRAEELARQTREELESMVRSRTLELELAKASAEAASESKSRFLAMMSHEIRTPLNGVIGMLKLLPTQTLSPRQMRWLGMAQTSANGLLSIINDILDFSKVEAGKLELRIEDVELPALVDELSRAWSYRATAKGIHWMLSLAPSTPRWVRVDPNRLTQVIVNLLSNAIKFTERGQIEILVTTVAASGTSISVRFEVKDTGLGIPPEQLPRLFQPFSQLDNSATRRYGGTGLGLGICKHLVELMGGKIGVVSTPGSGSTFWFELPLATTAGLPEVTRVAEASSHSQLRGRVLLAEDNEINRELAVELIRLCGCECDVVPNGRGAVPAALSGQYDLVFMDCMMPEMDGYMATRAIRDAEAEPSSRRLKRIPIIAMTANALDGDRQACLDAGMDDYLPKPLDPAAVAEVLSCWLPHSATGWTAYSAEEEVSI